MPVRPPRPGHGLRPPLSRRAPLSASRRLAFIRGSSRADASACAALRDFGVAPGRRFLFETFELDLPLGGGLP
jgi:hypothetical protein